MSGPVIMLVAAEASGDRLGAGLARALKRRLPQARFVGVGGEAMAAEGVASPFDIAELSVLGLVEGVMAYPRVVRRVAETAALAKRERPNVAVLIDSWGFTLRVAKALRAGDPSLLLIKYVGPQVWASRPGRANTLAAAVDRLLTIHSFDAPYFEGAGLKTVFVGQPALARDFSSADPQRLRRQIGAEPTDRILLVLPGSRPAEIRHMAPVFREACAMLAASRPDLKLVLPVAGTVAGMVREAVADWPAPPILVEGDEAKGDAFVAATAALACSGTVSTELALAGCPMAVGYRIGGLSYAVLKRLMTTRYITLFNIAAGREIAPEFVQDRCTAQNMAAALAPLLDDPARRDAQAADQFAALDLMGRGMPDPSERATDEVMAMLGERGRL